MPGSLNRNIQCWAAIAIQIAPNIVYFYSITARHLILNILNHGLLLLFRLLPNIVYFYSITAGHLILNILNHGLLLLFRLLPNIVYFYSITAQHLNTKYFKSWAAIAIQIATQHCIFLFNHCPAFEY